MSYQETVNEIIKIPDPVLAAKKLQDLAQGYRSQENIGVLVIRLMLSQGEKNNMRDMLKYQFENEQKLLAELKIRDIDRDETKKRLELEEMGESVPMDVVKMKGGKRRKQVGQVFNGHSKHGVVDDDSDINTLSIKPFPETHGNTDDHTMDWEIMLQKRLTEEVKDKELIHAMRNHTEHDPFFPVIDSDENWSTTTTLKGQVKERIVTLPPQDDFNRIRNGPAPPIKHMIPEADQLSTGSVEFRRELKHPLDVDRDAVLFHNMQLQRHKSHNMSSRSIDSIQSDPAFASTKNVPPLKEKKTSSHSIEVLLHGPAVQHKRQISFGGSQNLGNDETPAVVDKDPKTDSCPIDMTDRLKMLEQKGFLPKEGEGKQNKSPKGNRKIELEEADQDNNNEISEMDSGADVNGVESDDESDDDSDDEFEFFPDYETVESVARYRENIREKESQGDSPKIEPVPNNMIKVDVNGDLDHDREINVWNDHYSDIETDSSNEDINALYATVTKVKKHSPASSNEEISEGNMSGLNNPRKSPMERLSPVESDREEKPNVVHGSPKSDNSVEHKPESVKSRRPPPPPIGDLKAQTNVLLDGVNSNVDNTVSDARTVSDTTHPKLGDNQKLVNKIEVKINKSTTDNITKPHNASDKQKSSGETKLKEATPIPPRMQIKAPLAPKSDINSNSIRSLEDLIAYNRQQQKLSYKIHPKTAPMPPPKIPETTMVTKTASQRSIVITYL